MRGRRLIKYVVAILALVIAATATAYWTTSGSGSASATAGTLSAPTDVTGSSSLSTVSVGWTGSTLSNGTPAQGYYVTRTNTSTSATSPACGSSASSLISGTSCSDTSVPDGTYTYKVTAVYSTWTAVSAASGNVTVVSATLDHFTVTAPASATAGSAFSATVVAKDASNNTLTGYTGTIHFASSDSNSPTLPSNYTFVAGDNGSHAFTNGVTLKTAGNQTVSVNDTVQTSKTGTATISVAAGALDHFSVSAPGSSTAGTAFSLTATAKDSFNNTLTAYVGTIHFASSDSNSPTLPSNYTFVAGDNGSHAFTNGITLKTSGSQTVTVNDTVQTSKTGTATVNVSAASADHFKVTAPTSATAGTAFSSITVTAQDLYNNTATSYANGIHTITWSGASASPGGNAPAYPTSTVSFTNGVSTTALSATLFAAGSNSLTASATTPTLTGTASITVSAGSASKLAWTHIVSSSGTAVPTTCLFTCTYAAFGNNANFTANVSVTDTWGNTVSALGSGHSVSVTRGGDGGAFTAPTTGNPVSLTISAAGPADSTTTFTFRSQNGSWNSDTLTAHPTAGTAYTDATATISK